MTHEDLQRLHDLKAASRKLALAPAEQRSKALHRMAELLEKHIETILAANEQDRSLATEQSLAQKRINILSISEGDIRAMAAFFRQAAHYADPVGQLLSSEYKPNGLRREKRLFPLGVIAMVYEARPSVVTDSAALCLRTGNALLLRCSSHCRKTDETIVALLRQAMTDCELPADAICLFSHGDHALTYELSRQDRLIDLMILRGGYTCLDDIRSHATVPTIGAGPGNCHIYIDASAKPDMAEAIVVNSKVPRPLACNAAETLLVHRTWAEKHLPALLAVLKDKGLQLHGCSEVCALDPDAQPADENDWAYEYFAPTLAVKIVAGLDEAIEHINCYRTPHTECIITEDLGNAAYFMASVEANVVCHNAATRLTDGMEFGMGGEMGISTQKYPYGGPIGPHHLMQQKYYLMGNGTLR